jgi:hypothetical protein
MARQRRSSEKRLMCDRPIRAGHPALRRRDRSAPRSGRSPIRGELRDNLQLTAQLVFREMCASFTLLRQECTRHKHCATVLALRFTKLDSNSEQNDRSIFGSGGDVVIVGRPGEVRNRARQTRYANGFRVLAWIPNDYLSGLATGGQK